MCWREVEGDDWPGADPASDVEGEPKLDAVEDRDAVGRRSDRRE